MEVAMEAALQSWACFPEISFSYPLSETSCPHPNET
jgi:hypothetical protein